MNKLGGGENTYIISVGQLPGEHSQRGQASRIGGVCGHRSRGLGIERQVRVVRGGDENLV